MTKYAKLNVEDFDLMLRHYILGGRTKDLEKAMLGAFVWFDGDMTEHNKEALDLMDNGPLLAANYSQVGAMRFLHAMCFKYNLTPPPKPRTLYRVDSVPYIYKAGATINFRHRTRSMWSSWALFDKQPSRKEVFKRYEHIIKYASEGRGVPTLIRIDTVPEVIYDYRAAGVIGEGLNHLYNLRRAAAGSHRGLVKDINTFVGAMDRLKFLVEGWKDEREVILHHKTQLKATVVEVLK